MDNQDKNTYQAPRAVTTDSPPALYASKHGRVVIGAGPRRALLTPDVIVKLLEIRIDYEEQARIEALQRDPDVIAYTSGGGGYGR